jgi:hypothetical protein
MKNLAHILARNTSGEQVLLLMVVIATRTAAIAAMVMAVMKWWRGRVEILVESSNMLCWERRPFVIRLAREMPIKNIRTDRM